MKLYKVTYTRKGKVSCLYAGSYKRALHTMVTKYNVMPCGDMVTLDCGKKWREVGCGGESKSQSLTTPRRSRGKAHRA